MDQPTCRTCPYVHKTNAANYCRRFPPQGYGRWAKSNGEEQLQVEVTFPFVDLDWWCGEHPNLRGATYEILNRV